MRRRYRLGLVDLPRCCDGCGAKFTIKHVLACKKVGLVAGRHNEVKAETDSIAIQALGSNMVHNEPKIITCCNTPNARMPVSARTQPPFRVESTPSSPHSSVTSTPSPDHGQFFNRGNLLISGLWEKQAACVVNTRVINMDQPSYYSSTPAQALASQGKVKKKKYGDLCSEQRRHFSPYVVCVSGLLGREASALNKRIALFLARKWDTHYSVTCGYVNARMSVAILRASHLCIRGSRVPFRHTSTKITQWDDGV